MDEASRFRIVITEKATGEVMQDTEGSTILGFVLHDGGYQRVMLGDGFLLVKLLANINPDVIFSDILKETKKKK